MTATKPVHDDFDMPDLTDEMLAEFRPQSTLVDIDLRIVATQVISVGKPKTEPFDLGGVVCDAAVGAGYLIVVWLLVQAWTWILFS